MAGDHTLIELDRQRRLRYDLNAFAEIEDRLGIKMHELPEVDVGLKTLRTLLWAGLLWDDPALTERDVGAMVDMDNFEYATARMTDAFTKAMSGDTPADPTMATATDGIGPKADESPTDSSG